MAMITTATITAPTMITTPATVTDVAIVATLALLLSALSELTPPVSAVLEQGGGVVSEEHGASLRLSILTLHSRSGLTVRRSPYRKVETSFITSVTQNYS